MRIVESLNGDETSIFIENESSDNLVVPLSQALAMYSYCATQKSFNTSIDSTQLFEIFEVLKSKLITNEVVYMSFIAAPKKVNILTNIRLLSINADDHLLSLNSYPLVTMANIINKQGSPTITMDIEKLGTRSIEITKHFAPFLTEKIKILKELHLNKQIKSSPIKHCPDKSAHNQHIDKNIPFNSVVDELKELKNLVDMGILTEEEFIIKKKQLLNI